MYSDMSRRTIAFSSSERNSASTLASSGLPTPVGPRKRNQPNGIRIIDGALGAVDLGAQRFGLRLLLAVRRDGCLLLLPVRAQSRGALLQLRELPLELREAILARGIGLLTQSLALDLEPRDG